MIKLKIKNTTLTRHLLIAAISVFLTFIFWMAHFEWHDEMRLWRAFGDAGYFMSQLKDISAPMGDASSRESGQIYP